MNSEVEDDYILPESVEVDGEYGCFDSPTDAANEWLRSEYEEFDNAVDAAFSPSPTTKIKELANEAYERLTRHGVLYGLSSGDLSRTALGKPIHIEKEIVGGTSLAVLSNGTGLLEPSHVKETSVDDNYAFLQLRYKPLEGRLDGVLDYASFPPGDREEFERVMESLSQDGFNAEEVWTMT